MQIEGPNGCGKTTLLRMLATSLKASQGDIYWRQQSLSFVRQSYLADMLFIGHQPGVKQELTPLENLHYWGRVAACENRLSDEAALNRIGLAGYEDVPCYSLSAGQLRRVALARLLTSQATIWLLDETFTAIDRQGVADLLTLLTDHTGRGGIVILSTHQDLDLPDVRRLSLARVVA